MVTASHRAADQLKTPRLSPPKGMPAAQCLVWRQTVEKLPPDWFSQEQGPLLEQYCRHVCRGAQIEKALAKLDPVADLDVYEKLTRSAGNESSKMLALARAMRLTQQSRMKAAGAALNSEATAAVMGRNRMTELFDDGGLLAH